MVTKSYNLFVPAKKNRTFQKGSDKMSLTVSLLKTGWWKRSPMKVRPKNSSGKYEIVEGNNRYMIAVENNLPIYWVIVDDDLTIAETEKPMGRAKWSLADWLSSNIAEGLNNDYVILDSFQKETQIPLSVCINLFTTGTAHDYGLFYDGKYKIHNLSHGKAVGEIIKYCSSLAIPFSTKVGFVMAMSSMVKFNIVDTSLLLKKIRDNVKLLQQKSTYLNYFAVLSEVYCYKTYPKRNFETEVQNAMAEERKKHSKRIGSLPRKKIAA